MLLALKAELACSGRADLALSGAGGNSLLTREKHMQAHKDAAH
jgi:hypothetical protein